jgi:hypothetical protein
MGWAQQTVRWSNEYLAWARESGHDPERYPGAEVVARIGDRYYDSEHAARVALPKLRHYLDQEQGDVWRALVRYNRPAAPVETNPNGRRYRESIALAQALLAAIEDATMNIPTTTIGQLAVFDLRERYPLRPRSARETYPSRPLADITYLSIHHSAMPTLPASATVDDELARLDQIDRYHRTTHGWPAIAYPMAVMPSGRVYLTGTWETVRWLDHRNVGALGILLDGDFSERVPGEDQLRAAQALIAHCRYQLGNADIPYYGHRETDPYGTACPGATWPQWKGLLAPDPVAPIDPVRTQLDAIWGLAQRTEPAIRGQLEAAVIALKGELGIT